MKELNIARGNAERQFHFSHHIRACEREAGEEPGGVAERQAG